LDELQAEILNVKLKYLNDWTKTRVALADNYHQLLSGVGDIVLAKIADNCTHVYHQFVIRTNKRDALQEHLTKNNIGSLIHYPIPPHLQEAYKELNYKKGQFPLAEKMAETSLSLPLYPGLKTEVQEYIASVIKKFF